MTDLASQVEVWLQLQPGWVPAAEICRQFGVEERDLRAVHDNPGLLTEFAISSHQGFKHVRNASRQEFLDFKHRLRKHALRELRRTRRLDAARHRLTTPAHQRPIRAELDGGQLVFL